VKFECSDVLRLHWCCVCNSLHYLSVYSGKYLVRVRAQVMMRDDSTGGWLPMGGGGLSNVSVRKRAITCDRDESKHEYLIFGKRISDQSVSVCCNHKSVIVFTNVFLESFILFVSVVSVDFFNCGWLSTVGEFLV